MNINVADNPDDLIQLMRSAASTAVDMIKNFDIVGYMESCGIKFEEKQSLGPLAVMLVTLYGMFFAGFSSMYIMHKSTTKSTQDGKLSMDPKELLQGHDSLDTYPALRNSRMRKVLFKCVVLIPMVLLIMSLPMSTLFTVFSATRELLPNHEYNDLLKSSMLVDAIYGGFLFFVTVKFLGGLYNIFRRSSSKAAVNAWCSLNIFGEFVSIPLPAMIFAALFLFTALVMSPNPANDFMFYPVVLAAFIWGIFQAAFSLKKLKPFRYKLLRVYLPLIVFAILIYALAFTKEYISTNFELELNFDKANLSPIMKRVVLWSIFLVGLQNSAKIVIFIYWSICLDIARGKIANDAVENVSLISTETSNHDTVDKQAMPVSQETIPEPAYLTILSKPVMHGVYSKVAFTICAFANLYIYFYLKTHGIYLNSIQFTAISSIISRFLMVNGIFVLALVRRELRLVLNFEVEPIIEEPKSATITRHKAKGDVEDQANVVANFTDEPKEAEN